jgi:hypothetical protein
MANYLGFLNSLIKNQETNFISGNFNDVGGSYQIDNTVVLSKNALGASVKVDLNNLNTIIANSILGNNTNAVGEPVALTTIQTKSLLGISSVENTALSTWVGTGNITTLGNITSATIPKSLCGLSAVENTALSTWVGSTNLTTLGTLPSLKVAPNVNPTYQYPPGALTANGNTTLTKGYGSGVYNCTCSSELINAATRVFNAFDQALGASNCWAPNTNSYYGSANSGAYSGGTTYQTTISGTAYNGEWIQFKSPNAIILQNYKISNRTGYISNIS